MVNSSENRKKGAVLSVMNMVFSLLIGIVYMPFVLRFLGKSEYGVFTVANSLIAYLAVLDLGFGNALIRYSSKAQAEGKEVKYIYGMFLCFYSAISLIALACGLFIYFNIESFFTSFNPYELGVLNKVFIILLINTVIAFPTSVFSSIIRTNERFIFANGITLLSNVLKHVAIIAFLFVGGKATMIACLSLFFTILVAAINMYYCFKVLGVRFGFKKFDTSFYKEVFIYSFFILINIIVDQLYASTDNIILGKFCGSAVVAVYGVGVTFQSYFTQFSTSISGVFLPHVIQLLSKNKGMDEISNLFLKVGHIQFVILSFVLIGFFVYGHEFIYLWAGPGYDTSYWIALIIMVPAMIPLSQNIGISVLQAMNKHGIRSIMYLCIAIFNVLISIPLAIYFGGVGAAIGTAIGNLLGQILFMNWFYYKKIHLNIPKYWKETGILFVKSIPVILIFMLTTHMFTTWSWIHLCIEIIIGVAFVIPYYYFVILNPYEKDLVLSSVKKVIK